MDRRRHRPGRKASRGGERHPRIDDARPRTPSRAGSRLRPVLQPGNSVRATWRARLDEHLGNFTVEGLNLRAAAYLAAPHALYGITHAAALCRLLPERDPHPAVHATLIAVVECLM